MKKLCSLVLTLVLTAALFTGCGCTNSNKDSMTTPTGGPTTMPTIPSTSPSTAPTTQATIPTMEETTPTGNGAMEDETNGSTDSTGSTGSTDTTESTSVVEGRARRAVPFGN